MQSTMAWKGNTSDRAAQSVGQQTSEHSHWVYNNNNAARPVWFEFESLEHLSSPDVVSAPVVTQRFSTVVPTDVCRGRVQSSARGIHNVACII